MKSVLCKNLFFFSFKIFYTPDSDNEDDMEEKGLDSTFLVRNDSKEVIKLLDFLENFSIFQVEKYVIHLKKLLVEGEGETVIELGIPIPSSSQKGSIFSLKYSPPFDFLPALKYFSDSFFYQLFDDFSDVGIPEKDFEKAMKNHDEILKQIPAIGTAISGIRYANLFLSKKKRT